jgi:addiction module HigA family antidote
VLQHLINRPSLRRGPERALVNRPLEPAVNVREHLDHARSHDRNSSRVRHQLKLLSVSASRLPLGHERRWPPPHPGEVLRELCMKPLGLTVTQAARALGVSRKTLSSILNGRGGISREMAVRLSLAFGTSAESWMNQQVQYDLWHAERNRKKLRVVRLSAA